MRFHRKAFFVFAIFFCFTLQAHAGFDLGKDVIEFRLENGMRWLLVPRHQAPVFAGVVMVRVGGADEEPGKTGLAHVFEHMAFKGTSKIGTKDFDKEKPILDKIEQTGAALTEKMRRPHPNQQEIDRLIEELKKLKEEAAVYQQRNELWEVMARNGAADLNAYTSKDVTAYHASMPINKLPLWLNVVSQMVSDPVYRDFFTERDVILEERRSGIEDNPNGKMSEMLLRNAFQNGPYNWLVIGTLEDVGRFTIADARDFHERYYTADKMVGVLVGDFKTRRAEKMIRKYFGDIPAGRDAHEKHSIINEGGGTVKFAFDAGPAVALAYHKPTLPHPDEFVFDVIQVLMCDGPTSRLQKRLIYDEKAARVIYCSDSFPGSRFDNLFLVWAEPNQGVSPKALGAKIEEELVKLKTQPVSEKDLAGVRKKVTAQFIYALEKNMGLAMALAEFETVFNDWRLLINYPKKIDAVTTEDVLRVAKHYFIKSNQTEVIRQRRGK